MTAKPGGRFIAVPDDDAPAVAVFPSQCGVLRELKNRPRQRTILG